MQVWDVFVALQHVCVGGGGGDAHLALLLGGINSGPGLTCLEN